MNRGIVIPKKATAELIEHSEVSFKQWVERLGFYRREP